MKQAPTYPKNGFARCYMKALFGAAIAFGLTHAAQALAVGALQNGVVHPRLDAILTLFLFEMIEALIFLIVGLVLVLIPARIADQYIVRSAAGAVDRYCWLGLLAGLIYLPLCAGISTSILQSSDDPSFLQRCLEFLLPMAIAGVTGGYIFGTARQVSSARRNIANIWE